MKLKTKEMLLGLLALVLLAAVLAAMVDRWVRTWDGKAVWAESAPQAPQEEVPAEQGDSRSASAGPASTGGVPAMAQSPASWIVSDDYPAEALRNEWQGEVRIEWMVDETGRAHDCTVIESSGHAVLDEAACSAILRRAHYDPARDADGKPIISWDKRRVVWRLPE